MSSCYIRDNVNIGYRLFYILQQCIIKAPKWEEKKQPNTQTQRYFIISRERSFTCIKKYNSVGNRLFS